MRRHIHTISHSPNAGNETKEDMVSSSLDTVVQTQFYEQSKLILVICNSACSVQLMGRE